MMLVFVGLVLGCASDVMHPNLVAPFIADYQAGLVVPPPAQRHRRSLESPPISGITIIPEHMSADDIRAIGIAYKFMTLVYTADGDTLNITVQASPETISTGPDTYLVGLANPSTKTITMYTSHIPTSDAFVVVLLHEMLHLFGFSTLSSEGAGSFVSRANPYTLTYNSSSIALCAGSTATVHTDLVHWNTSHPYFTDDTMLPVIRYDKTATTKCTVLAVLESRPGWEHNLCDTSADCAAPKVCRSLGRHWIKLCQHPLAEHKWTVSPSETILNMLAFSGAIVVLIGGILTCHNRDR